MDEFVNRTAAQRRVLRVVNQRKWPQEELFGLSRKAIGRWVVSNGIPTESPLLDLIEQASTKLFFLANKSQEQISEEYQTVSSEITAITLQIEVHCGT